MTFGEPKPQRPSVTEPARSQPSSCPSAHPSSGSNEHPAGRVLGLDVGSRRIGLAVSDPLGITAQGLETLQRRNKRTDLAALQASDPRVRRQGDRRWSAPAHERRRGEHNPTRCSCLPRNSGSVFGCRSIYGREADFRRSQPPPARDPNNSIEKRAKAVDRMAAVLILQGWMESQSRQPVQPLE